MRFTDAGRQRAHERDMKQMDYQMKLMEFAEKRNMTLDQVKAELAGTAMKIKAQQQLSAADRAERRTSQVLKPPTEPAGRAQPGHAFEQ